MAAYPTFPQLVGTEPELIDDIEIDRAVGGGTKVRGFYSAVKHAWTVLHLLNATDRATFDTFYTTNRHLLFTFVWDGVTYNDVYFDGPPKTEIRSKDWRKYTVKLVER